MRKSDFDPRDVMFIPFMVKLRNGILWLKDYVTGVKIGLTHIKNKKSHPNMSLFS